MMDDPEGFLEGQRGKRVVLDEVHRLDNPSQLESADAGTPARQITELLSLNRQDGWSRRIS